VYNSTLSKCTDALLLLDSSSSELDLHLLLVFLTATASQPDLQDADLVPESSSHGLMGFPTRRKHWRKLRGMALSLGEAEWNVCARVVRGGRRL